MIPITELLKIIEEVRHEWWEQNKEHNIPPQRFGTYRVLEELKSKIKPWIN